ncbi:hypothetical protein ACE1MK_10865 [Tenacibaculum maritimum]|uniref:hypothetical protein n=1 Tax=Tenacibaculum maritimum TaxID=107401 RepID=UPI0012E47CE8|nr:hypothetical protein [Tenacibaculum maritimum]MCD9610654.1 hypothetical protein [Tenacibaculum maritimum]CAA0227573.1 conserved hypothetical protein [Tenacibaculum maritimum]
MAISIDSIETLQRYLNGVLDRADHHAGNVEGVSLALLGAIVWKSDKEIEVREYNGSPANMIWFWVDGNRYAMSYNHSTEQIELKERTHKGGVLHSFDNTTSYQEIIEIFNNL